jgi:hypothetical protein
MISLYQQLNIQRNNDMQPSIKQEDMKVFSVRMPKDMWVFLKTTSIHSTMTMNEIIVDCVNKYKIKIDKRLTSKNT